jgi:hypothetical protein
MTWVIVLAVVVTGAVATALALRGRNAAGKRTAEPHNIYPMW